MIVISGVDVRCNGCGFKIAWGITELEAQEIERSGRDCIKVGDGVYCCEECAEKAKRKGEG